MSVRELPQEELQEMSFIEVATALLTEAKQPMSFQQMVDEIASILSLSEEETKRRMIPFYTDLNVDGRFLAVSEGRFGLRSWYPLDQVEEEQAPTIKVRKKKAKVEEEDGFDDIEEDLDLDELDDFEEEDLADDGFDAIDADDDDDDEDDDDLEVIDEDLDLLSEDEDEEDDDLEDDLDEDEEL